MKYSHINQQEREIIMLGLALGKSHRSIAIELGRSHTTISREVTRNQTKPTPSKLTPGTYLASAAHGKAQKRASNQRRKAPLKCPFVFLYVRNKLRARWSPEQIAGRLSMEYPKYSIHHETIYRYIYSKPVRHKYKLWKYLTLGRKKRREKTGRSVRRLRGKIRNAVSIEARPASVEARAEFGHFETDLMLGPQTSKPAVSATIERKTRFTKLSKVPNHTAEAKTSSLTDTLSNFSKDQLKSMTVDNGKEHAHHQFWTARYNMPVYFCHPYHSWERGSVENVIGRVRRKLPKGTDLAHISQAQLQEVENWINHTPRKCLGWRTPYEALQDELTAIAH